MNPQSLENNYENTFWGLGDDWWKQIIDGEFHKHGCHVFDQGLHDGTTEPGFLESAKNGCQYAIKNISNNLTLDFYKTIHKFACSHFAGAQTQTASKSSVGKFRNSKIVNCLININDIEKEVARKNSLEIENKDRYLFQCGLSDDISNPNDFRYDTFKEKYGKKFLWAVSCNQKWVNRLKLTRERVSQISKKIPSTPDIVSLKKDREIIRVSYNVQTRSELNKIVNIWFDEFNKNIQTHPRASDEALSCIADLYQKLEWLHPFEDGQGRTDLILLSALLSKYGFNPSILHYPYVSTWSDIKEWENTLKKGISIWKQEYGRTKNGDHT